MTESLDAARPEVAGDEAELRSVDAQISMTLDAAVRPQPVRVAISEAQGLLCAEEVVAEHALPGFDQAAIDGYAVRSVDVRTAGQEPVQLPVVGEIAAGSRQPRRLQPGQAVRVDTGAPLPTLADAVVPLAYTDGHQARVTVHRSVPSAGYVRRTGEDVQTGDVAVRRGDTIGSAQVGLLAAVGRDKVLVLPAAAGVDHLGRRRAGRHRPDAVGRAGLRRQLVRARRGRPGRGRRGQPGRHRAERAEAAAGDRRGPAADVGDRRGRGRRRGRHRRRGPRGARRTWAGST